MKNSVTLFCCLTLVLALVSCATTTQVPIAYPTQIEAIKADKELTTFLMLSDAAGGLSAFAGGKKHATLIAPTDQAYNTRGVESMIDMLNPQKMDLSINSIKEQIVEGSYSPEDLAKKTSLMNLNGKAIAVSKAYNVWSFNEAKVIRVIRTKEGYLYVVNKAF
jgi:uncharacterized surface protein with fasciclin (FAS1) repeats